MVLFLLRNAESQKEGAEIYGTVRALLWTECNFGTIHSFKNGMNITFAQQYNVVPYS